MRFTIDKKYTGESEGSLPKFYSMIFDWIVSKLLMINQRYVVLLLFKY